MGATAWMARKVMGDITRLVVFIPVADLIYGRAVGKGRGGEGCVCMSAGGGGVVGDCGEERRWLIANILRAYYMPMLSPSKIKYYMDGRKNVFA